MDKALKTRLFLAGAVLLVLLLMSCAFGVKRTVQIVAELFGIKLPDTQLDQTRPAKPGEYLFCFWNVENLFDDSDDGRKSGGDDEYDPYFGNDPVALGKKLDHLCDVLIPLNGGRGPDILGACEVESKRAAQLLADAMNKRLKPEDHYTNIIQEGTPAGRHISPVLITRLPVIKDRIKWKFQRRRILRTVLLGGEHELIVVVSHWTSRVSDKTGESRQKYADLIFGNFQSAFKANPAVDYLVCGDFNDNPDDTSVAENLHASGDLDRVKRSSDPPLLFDLFAKSYADGQATHVYGTKKYVFDHICVSPGMLDDQGWSCDPTSARIITSFADKKGRPNKFGNSHDKRPFRVRGASDHFPVIVMLRAR